MDPAWRLGVWLATVPLAFVVIRFALPLLGWVPATGRGDDSRDADRGTW